MKAKILPLPMQAYLRERLEYDHETGKFKWRPMVKSSRSASWNTQHLGNFPGGYDKNGYHSINIDDITYLAHRLAWMYFYGVDPIDSFIDHINGDPGDNRIANLRLCSQAQNAANQKKHIGSKQVFKGVYPYGRCSWKITLMKNGISYTKYGFQSAETARMAYIELAKELHGEFYRAS